MPLGVNAIECMAFTPDGSVGAGCGRVKAKPCGRALARTALTQPHPTGQTK